MITLINQKQIRDFVSPTGTWTPTGWLVSGDMALSGLISGLSGYFNELTVENLSISGAVNSTFLSGILGVNTTGSGIYQFLAVPDIASGNNTHYRVAFSTGSPANAIQSFSSQDSQAEWEYYNNTTAPNWQGFPALGLNSAQQQSSFVRLKFQPTGFNINDTYYVHTQNIYAGDVTGIYTISEQFKANANGFTLVALPSLQSLYETADSRYVRKVQIGSDYVASGVKISGIPLIVPTYSAVPSSNHGTGTLISVSGELYNYDADITGYRAATPRFRTTGNSFERGDVIFSGVGGTIITQTTISGDIIFGISGGAGGGGGGIGNVTGIGIDASFPLFTGGFLVTGTSGVTVTMSEVAAGISGVVINGPGNDVLKTQNENDIYMYIYNTIGY